MNWRIDVELLRDGPEAQNAAKYWAHRPGTTETISWEHKISQLFGTVSSPKAAAIAAEFVVATLVGSPCPTCGCEHAGIQVSSRTVATSWKSLRRGVLCDECSEKKSAAEAHHANRVNDWMATFTHSLPNQLETLDDMLLVDKLTQSVPFKEKNLDGQLLKTAGLSAGNLVQLLRLHVIAPKATKHPESIKFIDTDTESSGVSEFYPFLIDWIPVGDGLVSERFDVVGKLASKELHGARKWLPEELKIRAKLLILEEAERYLSHQLSDRRIDNPTEAQLVRFRESVAGTWSKYSLGQIYSAIWPGCAKAVDNKARTPRMSRDAVTGLAVNSIVKTLDDFMQGRREANNYKQLAQLPLKSETISVFRIALDLDPMSALEADVAEVLSVMETVPAAPEQVLENVRSIHMECLKSMSEDQAFIAAMTSLKLLTPYYDFATLNAIRADFAAERISIRTSAPDVELLAGQGDG